MRTHKIQSGATRDDTACTTVSVSQSGRKDDLTAFANLHGGEGFVPAANDLSRADFEAEGATTVPRTVELADGIETIQPSRVVGFDGLSSLRNSTVSFLGDLVLQRHKTRNGKCE